MTVWCLAAWKATNQAYNSAIVVCWASHKIRGTSLRRCTAQSSKCKIARVKGEQIIQVALIRPKRKTSTTLRQVTLNTTRKEIRVRAFQVAFWGNHELIALYMKVKIVRVGRAKSLTVKTKMSRFRGALSRMDFCRQKSSLYWANSKATQTIM